MELNHYFISDISNPPRQENIRKQAAKLGITPRIFPAVMGRDMSEEDLTAAALQPTYLSPGEIGCALSHLGIYREFLSQEDEPYVWIFEDDVVFSDEFTLAAINELSHFMMQQKGPALLVVQKSEYHYRCVAEYPCAKIYQAHNLFRMHGYIINRQAAACILQIQTPVAFEMDALKYYWWLASCHLFCLNKNLADQEKGTVLHSIIDSDGIGARYQGMDRHSLKPKQFNRLYRRLPLQQKLLCMYRRIRNILHRPFETLDY